MLAGWPECCPGGPLARARFFQVESFSGFGPQKFKLTPLEKIVPGSDPIKITDYLIFSDRSASQLVWMVGLIG